MFKKFLFTLKMYFILGKDTQTFLDAKWIKVHCLKSSSYEVHEMPVHGCFCAIIFLSYFAAYL